MPIKPTPLPERFWAKVDKNGPVAPHMDSQCWLWTASAHISGYGQIGSGVLSGRKTMLLTHRVAYELTYGPIPDGMFVLHGCDTKLCVRPSHLRVGTPLDNVADMIARGRMWTKLTPERVAYIRKAHKPYVVTNRSLAERFGVSVALVEKIVGGTAWKHTQEQQP